MFTGIIEEVGTLRKVVSGETYGSLVIEAETVLEDAKLGDSIAVNGVCLTVTKLDHTSFTADVMAETMRYTNLGLLEMGDRVNLERAMAANGRFGGHIVSGHIDGVGTVLQMYREGNATWISVGAPQEILALIVKKGSIAIDGISLTVAQVAEETFQVSIIPHTGEETTLLTRRPGEIVNLENDIVGKYVEKLLNSAKEIQEEEEEITFEFLLEHGF